MSTWGEILKELQNHAEKPAIAGSPAIPPFDRVRRKYLNNLHQHTGRNTILYASSWIQPQNIPSELISIGEEDICGFMEATAGLSGDKLDIILHSPGGSAEATEALVNYLRHHFKHIRIIIPLGAMSAATMLACCADEIIMGVQSYIGPIDPQMIIRTQFGLQTVPTQAIIDQFKMAQDECSGNPAKLGVWLPIIQQYGPALLVQCEQAIDLSKQLVTEWLEQYMFAGDSKANQKAKTVADNLSQYKEFKSHGRHINRDQAKHHGLEKISNLEDDKKLQNHVLSVFHATIHTFNGTQAVKIVENHLGKAFVKQRQIIIQGPPQPPKS